MIAQTTEPRIKTLDSVAVYNPQQKINCFAIQSTQQSSHLLYIYGKVVKIALITTITIYHSVKK